MAQTTILAAGQTTATSSAVVITVSAVTVGLFCASAIPQSASFPISLSTPNSGKQYLGALTHDNTAFSLTSPGTYYIDRLVNAVGGVDIGVFSET